MMLNWEFYRHLDKYHVVQAVQSVITGKKFSKHQMDQLIGNPIGDNKRYNQSLSQPTW